MKYKINELIKLFEEAQLIGNENVEFDSIASLDKATKKDLSFLGNKKYTPLVEQTQAGVLLLPKDYKGKYPEDATVVLVNNPSSELAKICELIEEELYPKVEAKIHPSAVIDPSATIGNNVYIGANVCICKGAKIADNVILQANNYIGSHAQISKDCYIMANAVVMDYCILGERVKLQAGAIIGSDGYGYEFVNGEHIRVPQVGIVVIEDDVDIGANTCIDRARFDKTIIKTGTKIDNLVQIAHNVEVGKGVLLVSQVGISGSTKIGDYAVLGGQVGVAGHLEVGAGAMLGGQSGVNTNIAPKAYMRGSPPRPFMQAHKLEILINHLPELNKRVKELEERLGIEHKMFGKEK